MAAMLCRVDLCGWSKLLFNPQEITAYFGLTAFKNSVEVELSEP
jgi:hypothetical protein